MTNEKSAWAKGNRARSRSYPSNTIADRRLDRKPTRLEKDISDAPGENGSVIVERIKRRSALTPIQGGPLPVLRLFEVSRAGLEGWGGRGGRAKHTNESPRRSSARAPTRLGFSSAHCSVAVVSHERNTARSTLTRNETRQRTQQRKPPGDPSISN